MLREKMDEIYGGVDSARIPWNIEEAPELLRDYVSSGQIAPCRAIDIGCGLGHYTRYLARAGFDVVGIDFSEVALSQAVQLTEELSLPCQFLLLDILGDVSAVGLSFDFAFEWEVLHHIFPEQRQQYFRNIASLLNKGAFYFSVCFSEGNSQFGGVGKYRQTPLGTMLYFSSVPEIELLLQSHFEIDILEPRIIQGKYSPHEVIFALARRR